MIKKVDYIWNGTGFPTWNKTYIIDTGVFAESDCEIRIKYKGAGANVDRIVGFSQEGTSFDSNDFRIFYYSNGTFDFGTRRVSRLGNDINGFNGNNREYDLTMGNGWLYDNTRSVYLLNSTPDNYVHDCSIRVDVGGQRVNYLQIKNGGVVVFDAYAALDSSNNIVGLYDTISNTMFTNNNLNLTYGEIISTISIEPESINLPYSGGSSAITINTNNSWSASTNEGWVTITPSSGTSAVNSCTVSISENKNYSTRNGTVTFTDGENTTELTISQDKYPKLVFLKNLYREDKAIRMLIRNGSIIYREFNKSN